MLYEEEDTCMSYDADCIALLTNWLCLHRELSEVSNGRFRV